MTAPRTALVFDLDGTLIDSAPDLHLAANLVLRDEGLPEITFAQARSFIGKGAANLISRVMTACRASRSMRRIIGPMTNPMNRSIPFHSTPASTWTKFKSHNPPSTITATITARTRPTQIRFRSRMSKTGAPSG